MAACTPSIQVFLGRPLFLLSNGNHSIINRPKCEFHHSYALGKGKGKAIPLQAWTGPEGSRRLRLLDFKTIGT